MVKKTPIRAAEPAKPKSMEELEKPKGIMVIGLAIVVIVVIAILLTLMPPAVEEATEPVITEFCGDGMCIAPEDCESCVADCGECPEEVLPPAPPAPEPEQLCDECFVVSRIQPYVDEEYYLNANAEWIAFRNTCEYECDITGWQVANEKNMVFTFPSYIVEAGQEFFLHSGSGINNQTDIYWNRVQQPLVEIWPNAGELIRMMDASGQVVVADNYYP